MRSRAPVIGHMVCGVSCIDPVGLYDRRAAPGPSRSSVAGVSGQTVQAEGRGLYRPDCNPLVIGSWRRGALYSESSQMDGHTSMPALRLFFRNRRVKIGRGRLRLHGRCSLDQRDDVPLCVGIALNVPLRCCERRMAYQFLDVAQTTAGLRNFFCRRCDEGPLARVRGCTLDPNFPKPGEEPDRNRVGAIAGSALAVDDRKVRQHLGHP